MKKFKNKIILAILALATLTSCNNDPDNAIYDVFDGLTNGAVIRTLDLTSPTFDVVDLSSYFEVIVEEQDEESGDLLSSMDVYIASDGVSEALVRSIPASEFVTTTNGLPGTTIRIVLQDALDLLGLSPDAIACGDAMSVRLAVNLTDGRTFSAEDGSGSLQGSYFRSPYLYNVNIVANLPSETLFTGQYMLDQPGGGIFGFNDFTQGTYTIETVSNTIKVIKDVFLFPGFGGFGPYDVQFEFICGEIILTTLDSGLACADGISLSFSSADINSTYDLANPNDTNFIINFTANDLGGCGGSPFQSSLSLIKL